MPRRPKPLTETRAVNRAAWENLNGDFRALPRTTQVRILGDYKAEKARGGEMEWAAYLAAVLPYLPDEAR